jgi:hypothetical protein
MMTVMHVLKETFKCLLVFCTYIIFQSLSIIHSFDYLLSHFKIFSLTAVARYEFFLLEMNKVSCILVFLYSCDTLNAECTGVRIIVFSKQNKMPNF